METHVFKVSEDGEFDGNGFKYDCKSVTKSEVPGYLDCGWSISLDDALSLVSEDEEDIEQEPEQEEDEEQLKERLRKEIEGITGEAPHWNCSLETLQSKLSELKDGTGNN